MGTESVTFRYLHPSGEAVLTEAILAAVRGDLRRAGPVARHASDPPAGPDLETAIAAERHHLSTPRTSTRSTSTCPRPRHRLLADRLEPLGLSYAGIFQPQSQQRRPRLQSLHRARIAPDDISVAFEHGRELLDYVLSDLVDAC
jgi:hypothetical protein